MVKLADLPADVQRQVRAQIGAPEKATRTSQHTSAEGKFHMRCECGEVFTVEAAFKRHTPTKGHRRAEVVF